MIGDRWGVSDAEVARRFGCDDVVRHPTLEAWRGVTVHADAAHVWARVRQVRLAPYSYDLVDNLGRRSPRELRDVPEPVVGDPFTRALGRDQEARRSWQEAVAVPIEDAEDAAIVRADLSVDPVS